jgi:hypothetical protein
MTINSMTTMTSQSLLSNNCNFNSLSTIIKFYYFVNQFNKTKYCANALNKNNKCFLINLDLKKAFDVVNKDITIQTETMWLSFKYHYMV